MGGRASQAAAAKSLRANPLKRAGGENLAKSENLKRDLDECGADHPRWTLARAAQASAGGHGPMLRM